MTRNRQRFLDSPAPLPTNLSFVLSLSPSVMTLGLGNMQALLEALDHPERRFRSVVVAGTNGKGSVTTYLAAILHANGTRVGRYISPHVYDVTERIAIDSAPVGVEMMEEAAARIVPLHDDIGYSYFEALTAIAFLVFAWQGIDIAVLETGLGGRFDATNVVEPVVSVITGIALDHRRVLGDSEEEILLEKLGITRPNVPLVTGALSPPLRDIVARRTERDSIPWYPVEEVGTAEDIETSFDGASARIRTRNRDYKTIPLPFLGRHQVGNALVAIGAAELVLGRVDHLDRAAALVSIPGRFEVHTVREKTVVLDVAHNDNALLATCDTLTSLSPPADNAVVLGVLRRKELDEWPRHLQRFAQRYHYVEMPIDEASSAPQLLATIGLGNVKGSGTDMILEQRPEDERGWDRLIDRMLAAEGPASVLLITGSHRTVELFGRELGRRGLL